MTDKLVSTREEQRHAVARRLRFLADQVTLCANGDERALAFVREFIDDDGTYLGVCVPNMDDLFPAPGDGADLSEGNDG